MKTNLSNFPRKGEHGIHLKVYVNDEIDKWKRDFEAELQERQRYIVFCDGKWRSMIEIKEILGE